MFNEDSNNSNLKKYFHKNGRALGSMGYFLLLMIVFLIGAPEVWIRPNLHQSVFVMMPTLLFMVVPLVFFSNIRRNRPFFRIHIWFVSLRFRFDSICGNRSNSWIICWCVHWSNRWSSSWCLDSIW